MNATQQKKYEALQLEVNRVISEVFDDNNVMNKEHQQLHNKLINTVNTFFHRQRHPVEPMMYYGKTIHRR